MIVAQDKNTLLIQRQTSRNGIFLNIQQTQDILNTHYMLQVALLDPKCSPVIEKEFVEPYLEVHKAGRIPTADDYRDIKGLDVRPPDVMRYFTRLSCADHRQTDRRDMKVHSSSDSVESVARIASPAGQIETARVCVFFGIKIFQE